MNILDLRQMRLQIAIAKRIETPDIYGRELADIRGEASMPEMKKSAMKMKGLALMMPDVASALSRPEVLPVSPAW